MNIDLAPESFFASQFREAAYSDFLGYLTLFGFLIKYHNLVKKETFQIRTYQVFACNFSYYSLFCQILYMQRFDFFTLFFIVLLTVLSIFFTQRPTFTCSCFFSYYLFENLLTQAGERLFTCSFHLTSSLLN